MLLDFETLFLNSTNIMGVSRWEGVGWMLGVAGKLKAGYTIHWNRNTVVSLMKHRNSHSVHVKPSRSLVVV